MQRIAICSVIRYFHVVGLWAGWSGFKPQPCRVLALRPQQIPHLNFSFLFYWLGRITIIIANSNWASHVPGPVISSSQRWNHWILMTLSGMMCYCPHFIGEEMKWLAAPFAGAETGLVPRQPAPRIRVLNHENMMFSPWCVMYIKWHYVYKSLNTAKHYTNMRIYC